MFYTICSSLESDEVIKNNEVFCTQAPNNDDQTYCQCLQAQECVDKTGNIYGYRSGEEIIDDFSYTVSKDCYSKPLNRDKEDNYWRNIILMAISGFGFRLIGYLILVYKYRKSNR